jgi:hypothetical protein
MKFKFFRTEDKKKYSIMDGPGRKADDLMEDLVNNWIINNPSIKIIKFKQIVVPCEKNENEIRYQIFLTIMYEEKISHKE